MLTTVVIVLLLTGSVAPYTFTGGTENGSFACHCSPDVQCDDETGACPGDVCGVSGSFPWSGLGCQLGNVGLLGSTAQQTGDSIHVAERCIDGDRNNDTTQGSCCKPTRTGDELSLTIDLGGTFAIEEFTIFYGSNRIIYSSQNLWTSVTWNPANFQLCGGSLIIDSLSIILRCANTMVARYVYISSLDVDLVDLTFCEVQAQGYQYHMCGFYNGDYRYGPGCLYNCRCEHQCDVITGVCNGDCTSGTKHSGVCTCTSGFWGVNCESDCHCDSHNRACEGAIGACDADCDSGYSGFNCQAECDDRHWGSNCVHECHCDCDSITGACDGLCDPGYYGKRCEHQCTDGTWGIGNEAGCPDNCYCTTVPCDKVDGRCDGPCVAGRHGNSCQHVCDDGAWGEDCENTCNCYGDEVCEKIDGSCDRCPDWFAGVRCDQELPRMGDITPEHSVDNNNVTVRFSAPPNTDYFTVEYRTDGDWIMDAIRYPHNTQQNQQIAHIISVTYNIDYDIRIVPWEDDMDQPGEPSQVLHVFVPSLLTANITIIADKDVVIITMTDIEYMTELVSEYLVQYKLLHADTFISINVNPISGGGKT